MRLRIIEDVGSLGPRDPMCYAAVFLLVCAMIGSAAADQVTQDVQTGAEGLMLAQIEEGDIDQSFEAYGDDSDEIFEDDETLAASLDSLLDGVSWLGHASFLIEGDISIYIDPYDIPEDLADSLPKADLILVTHDHSDHFSAEDIAMVLKPTTAVVSIESVVRDLPDEVTTSRMVAPGDTVTVAGVFIQVVPAYNIGKEYHPRSKGYVGFVIHLKNKTVYHAGDTDVIPEMDNIEADIALLPIGGKYTMDAIQAAEAAEIIAPKIAVPMHWGKFIGTWEDAKDFQARSKVPVIIMTDITRPTEE
jgi:L-ascorbate metabolism protein UlaG (beta-lactamase superfamily)